jgi:aquaglyceroporin related protein
VLIIWTGRLDIEVLDEHGRDPGPPPDIFITDINGYPVEVRRVRSREAGREEEQGVERQDHYDSEQSQDGQGIDLGARKSYTPRYQGGLSTVNETDTASTETSETQQEKREAQSHHQQELQDFYNNYRNPLARLRARFPEAPAEFLAVSSSFSRC